jgi:N-acetylglutamate synthase-like GNAT family acetyltransferase
MIYFKNTVEREMELFQKYQLNGKIPNPNIQKFTDATIIHHSTDIYFLGISELIENDTYCYLKDLFIKKEYRKQGYATKIVITLIEECIKKNIHSIELESENNSMEFFKRFGFKLNGESNNRMVLNF